jgi:ATP-dependent DNA helicase RecG
VVARPPIRSDDPVESIKGIGPKTASALEGWAIRRVVDLVLHLPRRYQDRSNLLTVKEALSASGQVLVRGRVTVGSSRHVRRRLHIADGEISDDTGRLAVRWFNQRWVADRLLGSGTEAYLYGALGRSKTGRLQLVNPELREVEDEVSADEVVAIYPRLGPLGGRRLRTVIHRALDCLDDLADPLPEDLRRELAMPHLADALRELHSPTLPDDPAARVRLLGELERRTTPGHRRLAFDELLALASVVADHRARRLDLRARPIRVDPSFFRNGGSLLPFELTAAQARVVGEILADLARPVPMARLIQGDVGCGKTVVAALALLAVLEDGRQGAMMAPTELLAEQLHRTLSAIFASTGHRPHLLSGSVPAAEAAATRRGLADGSVRLVVGTHALIQESVDFADLGLAVIDEQHRFGVDQRRSLLDKGEAPHLLVMTATPIPRSLALTLYGDLDLSVIDELPPGRAPVRTEIRDPSARDRIWRFVRSEVEAGGRAFVVYPLIEASESLTAAALEAHESEVREALGGIEVGVIHGRLSRDERDNVAERFRQGSLRVILATTVIEVGVDIPAASVMVVESADRFGLSQLHQLRGRVGRGSRPSWCILITGDQPSAEAEQRLQVIARTTDGFEIAEADLRHRGPGELTGHRQWGQERFRFADLLRDHDLVLLARGAVETATRRGDLIALRDRLLRLYPMASEFAIG